jgi:uncharacterized delta-60 repeat protein
MKILLLLVSILIASTASAQITPQWVKGYNGSANNNDEAVDIVTDPQNNIIITGRVISTGNNNDIAVIKYSPSGSQVWAVIYNGPQNNYDEPAGITADNAGNIYVTGRALMGSSNYDIVTLKYNPAGVQQWAQLWSGAGAETDYANAITVDNAGNVYVTGITEAAGTNFNYITLKYNPAGALQWARTYNNPLNGSYDEAYFIEVDALSNVYITGESDAQGSGTDFYTIKYSASGDSSWSARYTGVLTSINDIPQGFAIDNSGNVYVTGFTSSTNTGVDYITIKYSTSGVEQWQARYGTPEQDIPEDLEVDTAGNVYVTGRTRINSSYNDFGTVKYNSAGVQQWFASYNNAGVDREDYGYDLELDAQGNVYVTGYSQSDGSDSDILTLKYNTAGIQQWEARYDSTNSEEGYAIALDSDNNVCVTCYFDNTNSDFITIKYSQTTSITPVSSEIPSGYILSQNYPNPFNPETGINFSVPQKENVKMMIYDITGKEAAVLVNSELPAGEYKVNFNASGLPSGVYFYTLRAGSFSKTRKMLLLK